jgi:hypothetical protein
MFGLFSGRKKYNGQVDIKLNNEYQIKTQNNSAFPKGLAYLELIDNAYKSGMNADEGALYIASLYFHGLCSSGATIEAELLFRRLISVVDFGLAKNLISDAWWKKFAVVIAEAREKSGVGKDL